MPRKLSEKAIASRLKLRFGKGTEQTKVFDEWQKSTQKIFRSRLKFEPGEIPVVAFYQANENFAAAALLFFQAPPDKWCLLTTRRILWSDLNGLANEIKLVNIVYVGWSSGPDDWPEREKSTQPDVNYPLGNGYGNCEEHSPWLQIVVNSGQRFDIFLEIGALTNIRNAIVQLLPGETAEKLSKKE